MVLFSVATGWNDKIVALEKTTWFHFHFMKTGFLFFSFFFFFVTDHLLVDQLCTNPKIDRSLLSCLKVTQCSTSEIGDAPLYNSFTQPIQVLTTGPLPAPSNYHMVWSRFGDLFVSQEIQTKNFMCPIIQDIFCVMHVPLFRIVKFKLLAQFPVHYLTYPVVS